MSEQPFPFTVPAGSDAEMFIQWKGTDVCLDFHCGECGFHQHIDEMFAYFVRCPICLTVYEMGTQVIARRTTDAGAARRAITGSVEDDDCQPLTPDQIEAMRTEWRNRGSLTHTPTTT